MLGLVGQHRRAGDVTDGIDTAGSRGPGPGGGDQTLFQRDPDAFQSQPFGVRDDPGGGNHPLDLERLATFERQGHILLAHLGAVDLHPGAERDPAFFERLLHEGRHFGILGGQDAVDHLDHRHLGPHRGIEAREFDPDRTRADDSHALRRGLGLQRLEIGPDAVPVRLQPRQHARARARGDDDVIRRIASVRLHPLWRGRLRFARRLVRRADLDRAGGGQLGLPPDHVHLVLAQKHPDPAVHPLGNPARAFDDGGDVRLGLARQVDPEIGGMVHMRQHLGGPEQRLGRDTAPVGTDTAQMLPLDHGGLHPQLRGPDRGGVATGATADHDDVVVCHSIVP